MSSPRHLLLLSLAVGIAAAPHAAVAAVNPITVATPVDLLDGKDGICSLREALFSAKANAQYSQLAGECPAGSGAMTDVVVLVSGVTYDLSLVGDDGGDLDVGNDPVLPADITDVRFETSGAAKATLRQTVANQRVMNVDAEARVEIDNLILRDGDADQGGGIYTKGGQVVLTRSTLAANSAATGGAVTVVGGRLEAQDSQFLFNTATLSGGAVELNEATGVFRHSLLQGNSATQQEGGGVYAVKSEVAFLDDSLLRSNQANSGAGVRADESAVFAQLSSFEENLAQNNGGAIFATAGSVTLEDATFIGNEAESGGAVRVAFSASPVSVTGGQFVDNTALVQGFGGGAIVFMDGRVVVDGTRFESNRALDPSAGGGAIRANRVTASNCAFVGNASFGLGGAIDVAEQIDLENCRFTANSSTLLGGAISVFAPPGFTSRIRNSVFSDNTSTDKGGALWILTPDPTIIANTTFSGNALVDDVLGVGSAIYVHEAAQVDATNITVVGGDDPTPLVAKWGTLRLQNSILSAPSADDCVMSPMDPLIVSLGSNLAQDDTCFGLDQPSDAMNVDVLLGPLADNGGATLTHALLEGSPAIDAGDGIACAAEPVGGVDQRGMSRDEGLNCDIGAFEFSSTPVDLPPAIFADGFEL